MNLSRFMLILLLVVGVSNPAYSKTIKEKLADASCEFTGQHGASVYTPTLVKAISGRNIVYTYTLEGCGGGNHSEIFIALVRGNRVVTAQRAQKWEDGPFITNRIRKITVYPISDHCFPGFFQLHDDDGKAVAYYVKHNELIPYLGGCD